MVEQEFSGDHGSWQALERNQTTGFRKSINYKDTCITIRRGQVRDQVVTRGVVELATDGSQMEDGVGSWRWHISNILE